MVGRFESSELRKEARAHEESSAGLGFVGRCTCLIGTVLTVAGLISPVLSLRELVSSPSASSGASLIVEPPPADPWKEPVVIESSPKPPVDLPSSIYGAGYAELERGYSNVREEPRRMGFDFSLLALCGTVFALCVLPGCLRPSEVVPAWGGAQTNPWMTGQQGPGAGAYPPSGQGFGAFGASQAAGGQSSLVHPGGYGLGNRGGMPWQGGQYWSQQTPGQQQPGAGPMDWAPTSGTFGGWQGTGTQTYPTNSWLASQAPSQAAGWGAGSSWSSSNFGSLGLGFLSGWSGLGFGAVPGPSSGQMGALGSLPSEAEVQETYATFGVELQQWVPAITNLIDRMLIEPLLQDLDESDRILQMLLAPRGWRLTTEAPRVAHVGIGPNVQELSVFDRYLPRPLCDNPQAVEVWSKRQTLEAYLLHPSFEPAQRQYVLDRLRDWRQRGVANAMHFNRRMRDLMPTDAHILENLVVQMLSFHLDFASCFLSTGHAPPREKHLSQAPVAFLRQVTDQTVFPKPPPHYEVATLAKPYRLRPGNTNILEALAILMHALRKSNSRSYQSFPAVLRTATEATVPSAGLSNRRWF
mmetsp:Transcript_48945/g.116376  ORF Transcript_48945/g.116376 Transcript_48945/m.116376 type:complete len:582 (-) Transcript_48945:39-1784(-)